MVFLKHHHFPVERISQQLFNEVLKGHGTEIQSSQKIVIFAVEHSISLTDSKCLCYNRILLRTCLHCTVPSSKKIVGGENYSVTHFT